MKSLYINNNEILKGMKITTTTDENSYIHSKISKLLVQRFYFSIYKHLTIAYKNNTIVNKKA